MMNQIMNLNKNQYGFVATLCKNDKQRWDSLSTAADKLLGKSLIVLAGGTIEEQRALVNSLIRTERVPLVGADDVVLPVYIKHISENNLDAENQSSQNTLKQVKTAVTFVDSDILRNHHLLVIPEGNIKDLMTENLSIDTLIYLSPASQLLCDVDYLCDMIAMLKPLKTGENTKIRPLGNLFIVAAQANAVDQGNLAVLTSVLNQGFEEVKFILRKMTGNQIGQGINGGGWQEVLKSRFFLYTLDLEYVRRAFEENVCSTIQLLLDEKNKNAEAILRSMVEEIQTCLDGEIAAFEKQISDKEENEFLYHIISNRSSIRDQSEEQKTAVFRKVEECKRNSMEHFERLYQNVVSFDYISKMTADCRCKSRKKMIQHTSDELITLLDEILKGILCRGMDDFIKADYDRKIGNNPFDAGTVLVYKRMLLAEKQVCISAKKNLGIIRPVFCIGKKKLVHRLLNVYSQKEILNDYQTNISSFWDEIPEMFDKMLTERADYLEHLRRQIEQCDVSDIRSKLEKKREFKTFLDSVFL